MKIITLLLTIVIVSTLSLVNINDDRFKTAAASILLPLIAGYFLYRVNDVTISKIGWGIFYGCLTVFVVELIILIYLLSTWKMTKLF